MSGRRPMSAKVRGSRPMSGRPTSGRPASGRPGSGRPMSGKVRKSQDMVSYEDLLVAQYLEELRQTPSDKNNPGASSAPYSQSPYLQKLAHTHIVPTPSMSKRPHSAYVGSDKPKIDSKFIADPALWDPATPRDKRRNRPVSAPVYKRPLSSTYGGSRPTSAKSSVYGGGKRAKALYKRQPQIIVVTAYKNGCRDKYIKVAAPTIKMLLEYCTDKLELGNAARRIFLDDGTEVFTPQELMRDSECYISAGENFKNPWNGIKRQSDIAKKATWTMNGVMWDADAKRRSTKPKLSKRFRTLIEQSRRRVLVFRNGAGSQGIEIVADPERFEDFLVACTAKLDLGTYARVLYDWSGNEISNLNDAPVLDQCLQTWSTPVLGPLWVSKGEGFSPKGVKEFLTGLITYTKGKLKEAKHYQKQLEYAQNDDTKEKVEIVAILSLKPGELEETLDIVSKDIEDFSNALNRLKEQMTIIGEQAGEEDGAGQQYTMKHIEEVKIDSRLVGTNGIKLKVYENGTYEDETSLYFNLQQATKGIGNDKDALMARLLDQCGSSSALSNPKQNPAIRPIARKLFDKYGKDIQSVNDLEDDMEVWLSFGEAWRNPFTYVMGIQLDKVRAFDVNGQRKTAIREQLMAEDTKGKERQSTWESVTGIPEDYPVTEINDGMDAMEKEHVMGLLEAGEIKTDDASFLRSKDDPDLMLFGEPTVDTKKKKGSKDMWPSEAQLWVINKSGYIHPKANNQLVLGVTDQKVKTCLSHPTMGPSNVEVEGVMVTIQKKGQSSAQQQWVFTKEGNLYPHSHPDMLLTYLGAQYANEDSQVYNQEEGVPAGLRYYVAACQKIPGKFAKNQRWAIKQEKMENLGQWKHTRAENPEWNRRALSWPVKEDGEINDDYDWPMEGFFMPYAPPMQKSANKKGQTGSTPLRLLALKNGVRDLNMSTAVVGPDLSNMRKDMNKKKKKQKKRAVHDDADNESIADQALHCEDDLTILKLEFIMILERCTSMLDLPFAARRLFDEHGKEHFNLRGLQRDQLVYVSTGEPWSDPNLSKAEQQRRYLLSNLSTDVAQIKQFVSLRDPSRKGIKKKSAKAEAEQ